VKLSTGLGCLVFLTHSGVFIYNSCMYLYIYIVSHKKYTFYVSDNFAKCFPNYIIFDLPQRMHMHMLFTTLFSVIMAHNWNEIPYDDT